MLKTTGYKGFPDDSLVISVQEASKLVGQRNEVFVDTRNYWKYVKGHVPNAINFETYAFHWVDTSKAGLRAFKKEMEMLISSFGIDKSKEVIFYQNNTGYDAARGVWLLWYLGHRKAKILDGGLNMWKKMRFPIDTHDPRITRTNFKAKPDRRLLATLDELSRHIDPKKRRDDVQLLDVRSSGEFSGSNRRAVMGGHIPRALNVEWSESLRRDGSLKSASTLEKMYAGSGLDKGKETITYCQSGYRAAHSWLVLKTLGFNARNYLGSWYEWGNHVGAPVAS